MPKLHKKAQAKKQHEHAQNKITATHQQRMKQHNTTQRSGAIVSKSATTSTRTGTKQANTNKSNHIASKCVASVVLVLAWSL